MKIEFRKVIDTGDIVAITRDNTAAIRFPLATGNWGYLTQLDKLPAAFFANSKLAALHEYSELRNAIDRATDTFTESLNTDGICILTMRPRLPLVLSPTNQSLDSPVNYARLIAEHNAQRARGQLARTYGVANLTRDGTHVSGLPGPQQ